MNEPESFACRTCRRRIVASGEFFPFCSERCRLVDLGRWFEGDYKVSTSLWPALEEELGRDFANFQDDETHLDNE